MFSVVNTWHLAAALVAVSSTIASARLVTFAVVGFGQEAAVRIGGTNYPLEAPWPADPYYNGTVEVPAGAKTYNYVIDGKPELFDRVLGDDVAKTLNEFYGREVTYQPMPQFNSPFSDKNGAWTRSSRAEIFDGGYIPTVHFSGANAENYIITAEDAIVDVLFVGHTEAVKYEQVSASAKNDEFAKAQLKVDFDGKVFYGRSTVKLRNSEEDATLMREQLYVEMLRAAGAPTIETNKARVYYNKKEYGLLELQDQANDDGFVAELFYGNRGQRPDPLGVPLDCSTGADFTPNGPYDAFQQKNGERSETNSRVALLSKALAGLDVTSEAAIAEFNKSSFDIDSFFKAMAMEYLAGHWDSYWYFTTNFVVYDDPTESSKGKPKFYFVDQDFDQTFGIAFGPPYTNAGLQATSESYKDLLTRKWKLDPLDAADRTMVNKLVKSPSILAGHFEDILIGIVKNVFNPDAVNSKLAALKERYRPEIEWDRQVKRPHKGISTWTLEDFDGGLDSPVGPIQWGLTQWVTERATAVAKEFNFQWDKSPLPVVSTLGKTPSTVASGEPSTEESASEGDSAADPVSKTKDGVSGDKPSSAAGDNQSAVDQGDTSTRKDTDGSDKSNDESVDKGDTSTRKDTDGSDKSNDESTIEIAGDDVSATLASRRESNLTNSDQRSARGFLSGASPAHAMGVPVGAFVALAALLNRA